MTCAALAEIGTEKCVKDDRLPKRNRAYDADRRLYAQVYNLPKQLDRARARVRQLEAQAVRLGLRDLVEAR